MSWPILACVAAACLYGLGAALQSLGRAGCEGSGTRGLATILRQVPYLAGLVCDLAGWLLAMYAVKHLPLFAVYTTLAGSVAVTVVLAWCFLHTPIRVLDGAAIGVVLLGLVLVGFAAGPEPTTSAGTGVRVLLILTVPFAGLLGLSAVRGAHPIGAAVTSGLLFSLGATTVRTVDLGSLGGLLTQPAAWAVLVYLAGGLIVHAHSLRVGGVGPVTAALWATEIIVAAVAGFVLFGDRIRPGALWSAMLGMVLALGATIQLTHSPSHTTAATPVPRPGLSTV